MHVFGNLWRTNQFLIWLWAFVKTLHFLFLRIFQGDCRCFDFPKKPAQISLKTFFKFILSFIRVSLENTLSTLKLKWKGTLFQYCRNWITLRLCPFPCSNIKLSLEWTNSVPLTLTIHVFFSVSLYETLYRSLFVCLRFPYLVSFHRALDLSCPVPLSLSSLFIPVFATKLNRTDPTCNSIRMLE